MKRLLLVAVLALPLFAATSKNLSAPAQPKRPATPEPRVSLDVKDEEVRVILASLRKQCGIRNMVVDKEVSGRATFLFRDLPCSTAFRTVFATFGLTYEGDPKLMQVSPRR